VLRGIRQFGACSGTSAAPPGTDYMSIDVLTAVVSDMATEFAKVSPTEQKRYEPSPAVLDRILQGCIDRQHVRSARAFIGSPQLSARLEALGFVPESIFRRVSHEAFEAMDARGLFQVRKAGLSHVPGMRAMMSNEAAVAMIYYCSAGRWLNLC